MNVRNIEVQYTQEGEYRLVQGDKEGEFGSREDVIFLDAKEGLVMAEWDADAELPEVYLCQPITATVVEVEIADEPTTTIEVEAEDDDDDDDDEDDEEEA